MNTPLLTPMPATEPHMLPASFPSPFAYAPHPLAQQAALLLQQRLRTARQEDGRSVFTSPYGKMFGVLVVQDQHGALAFLSGFSGMMNGQWDVPSFVPPLCDQTRINAFLPERSDVLAALTRQINQLEHDEQRDVLTTALTAMELQRSKAITAMKAEHQAAKEKRGQERQQLQQLDDPELQQRALAVLANASKRHDREAAALKRSWRAKLQPIKQQLSDYEQQLQQLKKLRSETMRELVGRVFEAYQLHNFLGERKPLSACFPQGLPPGGSGDCAAPKLIHYACMHQLQPIALAEFWWGDSPSAGIRHHGQFYPACRGKCRPILPFMLRGLSVESEPSHIESIAAHEPTLVYEDAYLLLVNKPAGLLSVPGKQCVDSVFERLRQRYPDCPELTLVHRLDRATSGLLLVAKDLHTYRLLQQQFIARTVEKRYEALLDGVLPATPEQGEIKLPLRVDLDDRPRQMVCYQHGKQAHTQWQRLAVEGDYTRVYFYPHTGRSHQLRVHASHSDGLNTPIVGDELYGRPAERMMLHAQRLCFSHPISHERMAFEAVTPF
jgi:tRNA pseudouridine32 synthase/23S rRNA pseudouridine746 synthase